MTKPLSTGGGGHALNTVFLHSRMDVLMPGVNVALSPVPFLPQICLLGYSLIASCLHMINRNVLIKHRGL